MPIRNEDGEITGLIGISADISAIEEAEAAVRESEDRFQAAVGGTNAGIFDWNLITGEHYRSPSWHEMFGYEAGEIDSGIESTRALVHPDDSPIFADGVADVLAGKTSFMDAEFRLRTKTGGLQVGGRAGEGNI